MEILVFQEQLNRGLTLASKFLPTRSSLIPTLQSFLLLAEKNTISLIASDLESTIKIIIPGKIIKEGKILLPAKTTISLLSSFSGEKVTIKQEERAFILEGGSARVSLRTEAADDYPQTDEKGFKKITSVSRQVIEDIVRKVVVAVSQDQTRAVLTGVSVSLKKEGVYFAATDGFRLSLVKVSGSDLGNLDGVIVPARVLQVLIDAWQERKNETVDVLITEKKNQMRFVLPQTTITSRLVDGVFPDYQKIIPSELQIKITVSREDLVRAVKFASVIARDASNTVHISVKDKEMIVSANAAQTGTNQISLPVQKTGEDVDVAFNYRFLLDLLSAGDEKEVIFETNGALTPGVFRFVKNDSFLHVVMPVRLQEAEKTE